MSKDDRFTCIECGIVLDKNSVGEDLFCPECGGRLEPEESSAKQAMQSSGEASTSVWIALLPGAFTVFLLFIFFPRRLSDIQAALASGMFGISFFLTGYIVSECRIRSIPWMLHPNIQYILSLISFGLAIYNFSKS